MTPKESLYYLLRKYYYEKEYSTETFCDQFTLIYEREIRDRSLSPEEKDRFAAIDTIASRFSPFESDHLECPNTFYTEEDVLRAVEVAIQKLKIGPKEKEKYFEGLLIDQNRNRTGSQSLFSLMDGLPRRFNWLITDTKIVWEKDKGSKELMRYEKESFEGKPYCFLSEEELKQIVDEEDVRWLRGVLSAVPHEVLLEDILELNYPTVEESDIVWGKYRRMQLPYAEIEIVVWDERLILVASKDEAVIEMIRKGIPGAESLFGSGGTI